MLAMLYRFAILEKLYILMFTACAYNLQFSDFIYIQTLSLGIRFPQNIISEDKSLFQKHLLLSKKFLAISDSNNCLHYRIEGYLNQSDTNVNGNIKHITRFGHLQEVDGLIGSDVF